MSEPMVCVKNTFIDLAYEPAPSDLCRAQTEYKPGAIRPMRGDVWSPSVALSLEPLRGSAERASTPDGSARSLPAASGDEWTYQPEYQPENASTEPTTGDGEETFVLSVKNTFINIAEPCFPDELRRAQSDRHWRPRSVSDTDDASSEVASRVDVAAGNDDADLSAPPPLLDLERAKTIDGYDPISLHMDPDIIIAERPIDQTMDFPIAMALPMYEMLPATLFVPVAVPLVMLAQDVWVEDWPMDCYGQMCDPPAEQASVGKSVRFGWPTESWQGQDMPVEPQPDQAQGTHQHQHQQQPPQRHQLRQQPQHEPQHEPQQQQHKRQQQQHQQHQHQQQQQQHQQEQLQHHQRQQQKRNPQQEQEAEQEQSAESESPSARAGGALGLERLSQAGDATQRFQWRIDARKLRGSDRRAASPIFALALGGGGGLEPVDFKIVIRPTAVAETKGGSSFKKAKGRGSLELNCLQQLDPHSARPLRFSFAVGSLPPRGPVFHDFAANTLCGLPADMEQWDFAGEVEPASDTFVVHLEVVLGEGVEVDGDADAEVKAR